MTDIGKHYFESWEAVSGAFAGDPAGNIKVSEERLAVRMVLRDTWIKIISGEEDAVSRASKFISELSDLHKKKKGPLEQELFESVLSSHEKPSAAAGKEHHGPARVKVSRRRKDISAKTKAQRDYIDAVRKKDIVFGTGPAGTGKTYLAMALAAEGLHEGKFSRIVLTRPAREAGEALGFLPGNLEEKILPYLRPLYDALHDMMDFDEAGALISKGIIEIAPLAFMRGRTLNGSFVILDEAQNTTRDQMLMFLTRLGEGSKCVVTGDPSQTDLPRGQISGLADAERTLAGIPEIKFCRFTPADVVRHPLVEKIIKAYSAGEES
jgi:phosphate starvation-inducible PhoH-like protein